MKFTAALVLDQLPTPCLAGLAHQGEALGPPLLDARLHTVGVNRANHQRHSWPARTWRAEPPQRIHKAAPLHGDVLAYGGVPHDQADQVVDHRTDG
jgi:hypothetical protein